MPYRIIEIGDEDGKTKRQLDYEIEPLRPSAHNPQISQDLDKVALTAVCAEIPERFPTPLDFTNALLLA